MKIQPGILRASSTNAESIDWDSVYQAELPRIFNFFLYKVGCRESAEDLTASTFERAWRLRNRYRKSLASLPTWLFGIARNVLKEYFRKKRLSARLAVPSPQRSEMSSDVDLENYIQQQQDKEYLWKMLFELPEREQDLIALKYGAGLTNREIAGITRLSESNVGSILHRTINHLRKHWEEDHER